MLAVMWLWAFALIIFILLFMCTMYPYSASAAYERLACAITIAEELQLGATRPELPLSPALRHVRFIYYNPVDCSLKVGLRYVLFVAAMK